MIGKAFIILSLLNELPSPTAAQAAQGGALGKDVWLPLAKFTATAAKIPGRAAKLLQDRSAQIVNLMKLQVQADICLNKAASEVSALGWQALAVAIAADIGSLQSLQQQRSEEAIAAAAAAEFARGHAAEFFKVAAAVQSAANSGCLTTNNKGGAAGSVINGFSTLGTAEQPAIGATSTAHVGDDITAITTTGFSDLAATDGIRTDSLTADTNCVLFKGGSAGPLTTANFGQSIPFAGGYLTRNPTANTASSADGTDFVTNPGDGKIAGIKVYRDAHAAAAKIRTAATFGSSFTDFKKLDQAKKSVHLRTAVKNIILGKPDGSVADLSDEIDTKINQVFGEDQATFHSRFWDQLTKVKVEKAASGQDETTLDAITSFAALSRARTYYSTKVIKGLRDKISSLEIKNSKTEVKVTDADCNKHQSKDKCAAPCKWNENTTDINKKCSLDPVKATEQQAAQTAGAGEGAAGTTTDKCKDKKKDDCKSPDCKWEGETCKDSSILLNKQFALMVSAAFVALLF
uniref:Variant surface glycoprotein n=1 Tax=Trypanosoma brucei TaxID=5691 RepID=Q26839_9TRYP|nr:variant surface glycoprotein [Trypanosoma brucei rhodesiense]